MKCQFCEQSLPDDAKFCYKCGKQLVCMACGAAMMDGASYCCYCGKEVGYRTVGAGLNCIRYSENSGGKSFEASFSDGTAENVALVFARFLRNEKDAPNNLISYPQGNESAPCFNVVDTADAAHTESDGGINRLFREKEGKVSLAEKRLKSKNKSEQQTRASMLFLLYYSLVKKEPVTRDVLYAFMRGENLYDGNYRAWLSHHSSYFLRNNDEIELSPEGKEKANGFLDEINNASIESSWKPGASVSQSAKVKAKETKSSPYTFLDNLDLAPKDKISLTDFLKSHHYRPSAAQHNLLFVYYLKQVLHVPVVTKNHVYTCYRKLGVKLPNNLYHSLSDTMSKNRWLTSVSDMDLTSSGINYVEHNMKGK